MSNPKILNLDELETDESDIGIIHKGVKHTMRVLSVDGFIEQHKRQEAHEKALAEGVEDPENVKNAVQIIRDSVLEFFPSLPVGEMATPKLFQIFVWLNELSAKINEVASEGAAEDSGEAGEPGNEPVVAE